MTRMVSETTASAQLTLSSKSSSRRRVAALAAGDTVMFLLFAALGRRTHGEASGPAALAQIALTALPFALGWFLIAPFVGAFRRARTTTVARMVVTSELSWLLAWPAALGLRWILAADHRVPLSFALVVLAVNGVLLGLWRGLFAFVEHDSRLPWRR
jgi:Protein of unknown function (DUF3054)